MKLEIDKHGKILGKFYRFKNIVKRRRKIFKMVNSIESIVKELEDI